MKSKTTVLYLVAFLVLHQTRSALTQNIVVSEVKSFIVERNFNSFDHFTVNMKSHYTCTTQDEDVPKWCAKLHATHVGSTDKRSCKCQCTGTSYSFVPSLRKCIDVNEAATFGGCTNYFDQHILLDRFSVDLAQAGRKQFSAQSGTQTCSLLGGNYYVHDYSGFQHSWVLKSDGFFSLQMQQPGGSTFYVIWKEDTNGTLSGRIVRLNVTCTRDQLSWTSCVLLKADGDVTYYAPPTPSVPSPSLSLTVSTLSSSSSSSSSSPPLSISHPPPSSSPSFIQTSYSSASQPSLSPHQPLSSPVLLTSSALSPSPSLIVVISSTSLPSTQSQAAKLSSLTTSATGIPHQSTGTEDKPSKTITTAVSSSSATNVGPGNKGERTGGNDDGIVIGAAVGGALVLGILVIIGIVFWKRRKSGKNSDKQAGKVKKPDRGTSGSEIQLQISRESTLQIVQDDQPTYQGLLDENRQRNGAAIYSSAGDNYDNCSVYQTLEKEIPGSSVYHGLSKGQLDIAPTTGIPNFNHSTLVNPTLKPSAGGMQNSKVNGALGMPKSKSNAAGQLNRGPTMVQEPVCNVLDGPGTGPATTAEPLYNVLEGEDYATPNVNPLYNVLEGTNSNQSTPRGGPSTTEEAVYNVLQGPEAINVPTVQQGPENDAIYNVLERPDANKSPLVSEGPSRPCNEPLYNVLEEQDGHGSKQNVVKELLSPVGLDNPSYEQTLEFNAPYAAVHKPGRRGDSLYEPLRRPGQDLYEALG